MRRRRVSRLMMYVIDVDVDNVLGAALEAQPRRGDPDNEGVVFPTVAEISLLGGLGGGAAVLSIAALDELPREYEYVVLQATEMGIPFYEALGFTRVGVVAQHATSTNCTICTGRRQGVACLKSLSTEEKFKAATARPGQAGRQ